MARNSGLTFTERSFSGGIQLADYRGVGAYPFSRPDLEIGNALKSLGNALDGAAERQNRLDIAQFKSDIQQKYYTTYYDPETGMVHQRKGLAANGMTSTIGELSNAVRDSDEYKNLSPLSRSEFDLWYQQQETNETLKLSHIEQAEILSGQRQQSEVVLDNLTQSAATLPLDNMDGFSILRQQLSEAMGNRGELEGWMPEYTAMQEQNAFSRILANAALSSPVASKGFNFATQMSSMLTPEDRENVMGRLQGRLQNEYAQAEIAKSKQQNAWIEKMTLPELEARIMEAGDIETLKSTYGPNIAHGMLKEYNSLASANNKILELTEKKEQGAMEQAALDEFQQGGPEAAFTMLGTLAQQNSPHFTPKFRGELQTTLINLTDNVVEEAQMTGDNFYRRQHVLSEMDQGRGNIDMLTDALNDHLIKTDEFFSYKQKLASGDYGPVNSAQGKADWKFFQGSIFAPREKEFKGDVEKLALLEQAKRNSVELYNEQVREKSYNPNKPQEFAAILDRQIELTLQQSTPIVDQAENGRSITDGVLKMLPIGTSEQTAQYLIDRYVTEFRLKNNGRTPSNEMILNYAKSARTK